MKTAPFGDFFDFIRNGMNVSQDKSGNGLPITRIETIAAGEVDPSRVGYAGLEPEDCKQWFLEKGDLLLSHINSAELVGKCAVYRGEPAQLVHGMNLLCLRPKPSELDSNYAQRLIRSAGFRARLSNFINKAVNQASVSIANLRTIQVSVPPLGEQRRIAAILDKADALRQKRSAALNKLDILAKSVFLDMFGDPRTNDKSWSTVSFREIANFATGKLDSNAAVPRGAFPFFTCSKEDFSIDVFAFDCEALLLAGNNAAGEYSVKHYKGKFNAYQRTYVITLNPEACSYEYMLFALQEKLRELKHVSKGTGTRYLTLEILHRLQFQLPPLATQRKFASWLSQLTRQKKLINKARSANDVLFASLQYQAFRGRL